MDNSLRHDLSRSGMVLLIFLLSQNLLRMPFLLMRRVLFFLNGFGFSMFINQLAQTLVYVGSMLLTIFFGIWLMRCGREFLFPLTVTRTDYLYPAVGAGLGVGMLGNIIAALLTLLLSSAGVQAKDNVPEFGGGISTTLLTILAVTVLPAILEELLFRGVLLQPLRKYGDGIAVVLSALMFAVCHPTLPQFVNAFIMGLCLGTFAVRSGSLTTTMLIHLVYNSIACVVTMLPLYLPQATASLVGWLIIFSLVAVGIYSCLVLRHRFGSVWRLPRNAYIPTSAGHAVFSVLCSLPFVLALLFNLMAIFRNLYI